MRLQHEFWLVGLEIATRPRHGEVRLSDWVMPRSL